VCSNKEVLKRQSGVLSSLVKQVFKNFSMENILLPVRIFEPCSMSDQVVDLWRFAPHYLTEASRKQNSLDRLKMVMAFVVGGLYCEMQQLKPFNPLLGKHLKVNSRMEPKFILNTLHITHQPLLSTWQDLRTLIRCTATTFSSGDVNKLNESIAGWTKHNRV
jgi:hypothetical protein